MGDTATDSTEKMLTDEEIQEAFEIFELSPEKKRRSFHSRMRSLRTTRAEKVSYRIFEDKNASPAHEEKENARLE